MLAPGEIAKLRRFVLAHRDHFALALVRSSQEDVRRELAQWADACAREESRAFRFVDGAGKDTDGVWHEVAQPVAPGTIVMVTGLDEALREEGAELGRRLNRQREQLGRLLPGPVLLVLGDLALDRFLVDAPDLADWYAASFLFEREAAGSLLVGELAATAPRSDASPEVTRARIALLEGQLLQAVRDDVRARLYLELARLYRDRAYADGEEVTAGLEASVAAGEQAVALLGSPVDEGHEARLAEALRVLAVSLTELGRRDEALGITSEALAHYRKLAQARPEAFLPDETTLLNNYGMLLSQVGQSEKALDTVREAVDRARRLAESNPDAALPDLAVYLSNYAKLLGALMRYDEALVMAAESLKHSRTLVQSNDAFLPLLSFSLSVYSVRLAELGRWDEALKAASETVENYRKLATAQPKVFLSLLATALHNHGSALSHLGFGQEALDAAREELELRRKLADSRPAALAYLAHSLSAYAMRLTAVGRKHEALEATAETVEISRKLAQSHPDTLFLLATSLLSYGEELRGCGRPQEALDALREAVEVGRKLGQSGTSILSLRALLLISYGKLLDELGQHDEASQIYRELGVSRP